MDSQINIAVFISGTGSNARNIIKYFNMGNGGRINVALIVSNKKDSGAAQISKDTSVPYHIMSRGEFYEKNDIIDLLDKYEIQSVILAGFLWLVPNDLILKFPDKIINIHPALLPKYGGKGMYGMNVHRAVKQAKESTSGITIHVVNEQYDKGEILFQKATSIEDHDTPEMIAQKVQQLEYDFFPKVIEEYLLSIHAD